MNNFTSKLNNKSIIFYEKIIAKDLSANKISDQLNSGLDSDLFHSKMDSKLNFNSIPNLDLDSNLDLNLFISSDFKKINRTFLNAFIEKELQTIDQINNLNLSVSHTDTLGAVAILTGVKKEQKPEPSTDTNEKNVLNTQAVKPENLNPTAVGVDLEQTARLNEKLIRRIADKDEINLFNPFGHWQFIWPIKEAAFKAVYRNQKYNFCSGKTNHLTERISTNQNFESKDTVNEDYCIKTISQIKITSVKCVKDKIHFQTIITGLDLGNKYQSGENAISALESLSLLQVKGVAFSFQDHNIAVAILG